MLSDDDKKLLSEMINIMDKIKNIYNDDFLKCGNSNNLLPNHGHCSGRCDEKYCPVHCPSKLAIFNGEYCLPCRNILEIIECCEQHYDDKFRSKIKDKVEFLKKNFENYELKLSKLYLYLIYFLIKKSNNLLKIINKDRHIYNFTSEFCIGDLFYCAMEDGNEYRCVYDDLKKYIK